MASYWFGKEGGTGNGKSQLAIAYTTPNAGFFVASGSPNGATGTLGGLTGLGSLYTSNPGAVIRLETVAGSQIGWYSISGAPTADTLSLTWKAGQYVTGTRSDIQDETGPTDLIGDNIAATGKVAAGDTVWLQAGTYDAQQTAQSAVFAIVTIGTAADPVRIEAFENVIEDGRATNWASSSKRAILDASTAALGYGMTTTVGASAHFYQLFGIDFTGATEEGYGGGSIQTSNLIACRGYANTGGTNGYGIRMGAYTQAFDCWGHTNGKDGFVGSTACTMAACRSYGNSRYGANLSGLAGVLIDSLLYGNTNTALAIGGGGAHISGCTIDGNGAVCVYAPIASPVVENTILYNGSYLLSGAAGAAPWTLVNCLMGKWATGQFSASMSPVQINCTNKGSTADAAAMGFAGGSGADAYRLLPSSVAKDGGYPPSRSIGWYERSGGGQQLISAERGRVSML